MHDCNRLIGCLVHSKFIIIVRYWLDSSLVISFCEVS